MNFYIKYRNFFLITMSVTKEKDLVPGTGKIFRDIKNPTNYLRFLDENSRKQAEYLIEEALIYFHDLKNKSNSEEKGSIDDTLITKHNRDQVFETKEFFNKIKNKIKMV